MLFKRLKVLWLGFWSRLLGEGESRHQTLVAQGAIEQHRRHLQAVRGALTNLIYQRKKLQDQLDRVEQEQRELQRDVEDAARTDRDALALNLIARLETVQEEQRFLQEQLRTLTHDIDLARTTETQLVRDIQQAEQLIGTLTSRYQALKVRKSLQQELDSVTRHLATQSQTLRQPLADQIHRLEAEMEASQVKRENWEREWDALRSERHKSRHELALSQIKEGLRQRRQLPQIIVTQ